MRRLRAWLEVVGNGGVGHVRRGIIGSDMKCIDGGGHVRLLMLPCASGTLQKSEIHHLISPRSFMTIPILTSHLIAQNLPPFRTQHIRNHNEHESSCSDLLAT